MSEVKEDQLGGLELPESNGVQVIIEPATPKENKRGGTKEISDEENSKQTAKDGNENHGITPANDSENHTHLPADESVNEPSSDNNGSNSTEKDHLESSQLVGKDNKDDKYVENVSNQTNPLEENSSEKSDKGSHDGIETQQPSEAEKVETEGQNNAVKVEHRDSTAVPEEEEQSGSVKSSELSKDNEPGEGNERTQEEVEDDEDRSSSKKEHDATFQVTSDILTEDMERRSRGNGSSLEGSLGEKERTAKTPESIAISVDIPDNNNLAPSQSRMSNRPVTGDSFVYNDHDFPTPDYDIYGPTPTTVGSPDKRQLSPSKRDIHTAGRGDGAKSVTFAEDVSKSSEPDPDNEDPSLDKEDPNAEEPETKDSEEEEGKADANEEQENEESEDIFPTAVSEEKIAEAKKKQQDGFTQKESLAIELFGASKFEPESMEDVVTKRAYQHFEIGCRLVDEGNFGQAVICLDKALNLMPKEVKFYLMRGEAYLQLCDFQSAILNLKKACVLKPDNHEYYARLAFVYYFQGQSLFDQCLFPEALESFSRAAEMRPEIIAYHTRSIACLAALQRHGECLALVNKRLEIERNNPDLYIMRARLHQLFRNTTLCYYDLKDALALNPHQEEAKTMMKDLEQKAEENRNHATRLQLQGKFKDSLTKITIAIEMNPSVSGYHLQRGALHRRLHDYNAAIDDFLLAMDKTEHNEYSNVYTDAQRQLLLTYNDFAVECFLGSHFEEAILLLNKALKGEKREKGLYINRGDCFFRLQELHFALADYHQASELDATDPGIRSRVAAIHNQFGLQDYEEHSYQDAEARFTIAIQHNPKHGPYYISRCKVRLMMENQNGARHDFLMGLHLDSSNTEILTLMPRIYPGKSVGDVMRTKHAKETKIEAENAVVTASPIILPSLDSATKDGQEGGRVHTVSFASDTPIPQLKSCMDEQEFNKILTKQKKKISNHVKSLLHERGSIPVDKLKLNPIPPPRPYAVRGGHWKNPEPAIKPGWRTFSLGVGLME